MQLDTIRILAAILALCGVVALYILVLPERRRAGLPKFFQVVHDIFNFKHLLLEVILKFLYVFSTLFVILCGFFLLFGVSYGRYGYHEDTFLIGLAVMVLGPIVLRLIYEFLMMTILLVKNVIQINKKLGGTTSTTEPASSFDSFGSYSAPKAPQAPKAPDYTFCSQCGTRYDRNQGHCPNCGR